MSDREPTSAEKPPVVLQVAPRVDEDELGRTVVDFARRLAAGGWGSLVASAGGSLTRELQLARVPHEPLAQGGNPASILRNSRRLARLIRRHGVAIIHAHDAATAWAAGLAARRGPASLLTFCHDLASGGERGLKRRFTGVVTAGDRVVTGSDYLAERLVEAYGAERSRVRVVPPGIDLEDLDPARVNGMRLAGAGDRWGIGMEHLAVVVPAPFAPSQGHGLLLAAAQRIERRDFLLVFASRGTAVEPYAKRLERQAASLGLADRVRFVDESQDFPALLKLADAVALPAQEPLPGSRAVLAAQAMGKPVIVSAQGALPEMMMPGATGWTVAPNDPEDLARALELALSLEPGVRERLAVRARDFIAEGFAVDRSARRMMGIYRELLRREEAPYMPAGVHAVAPD